MSKLQLTGRFAALVGVGAAAAAAALVAVAAPAFAADSHKTAGSHQTTCTDQVRVRSEPKATAPVIGSCKSGEKITVSDTKDGFSHADSKKGWISSQYIAADNKNAKPGDPKADSNTDSDSNDPSAGDNSDNGDNGDSNNDDSGSGGGLLGGGL